MIDQVKSQLSAEEWKTYCEEHPDFIRIYDILVKDKRNKDSEDYQGENDDEKVVILKYYFKWSTQFRLSVIEKKSVKRMSIAFTGRRKEGPLRYILK